MNSLFETSTSGIKVFAIVATLALSVMYVSFTYLYITRRNHYKESRRYLLQRILPIFMATLGAVFVIIIVIINKPKTIQPTLSGSNIIDPMQIKLMEDQIRLLTYSIQAGDVFTNKNAANIDEAKQINEVKASLAITQSQIKQIQDTMMTDPQKVISLPLLKDQMEQMNKEIASLQNYVQSQAQFIKEAQSQVYWVIAVFAFGLLALIVPVIKATFSTNKRDEDRKEEG